VGQADVLFCTVLVGSCSGWSTWCKLMCCMEMWLADRMIFPKSRSEGRHPKLPKQPTIADALCGPDILLSALYTPHRHAQQIRSRGRVEKLPGWYLGRGRTCPLLCSSQNYTIWRTNSRSGTVKIAVQASDIRSSITSVLVY